MLTQTIAQETAVLTHKRLIITGENKPYQLETITESIPEPISGQVRVRVLAAGVAFADVLARKGMYPGAPRNPFTPGYDIIGVVDGIGSGVTGLAVGQMVAAILPKFGGYAEFVCLPADLLVPVPDGVQPVKAVSVILNYLTAYRMLHVNAQVKPGERVLVHSAAGGVGTALLQLGRIAGLEMFGTVSKGKHDIVTANGGTPIDYQNEDFAARVRQLTGDGVDVVCDPVGGETMAKSYKLLRRGGRLISFGFFSAVDEGMAALLVTFARFAWYKVWPDGKKALIFGNLPTHAAKDNAWYRTTLTELLALLADGRIDPVIGATLPLTEAVKAHEMLETGAARGKIVLTV